jgi:hypothetical protein
VTDKDETGWLVERPGPVYWSAGVDGSNWTTDPGKAVRFSREMDARLFIDWHFGTGPRADNIRAVEHMWVGQ